MQRYNRDVSEDVDVVALWCCFCWNVQEQEFMGVESDVVFASTLICEGSGWVITKGMIEGRV